MTETLYKPRIFISHSAKEIETRTLCEAIVGALDPGNFEVLWDGNLQTSQVWRPAIDEWIWRCDAAVLLISMAATESKYVAYEATLLRQRWKHTGGKFLLIPVWCPGVTEQMLAERMGALQLGEIQTNVKLATWPPDAATFEAVAKQVRDTLEAVRNSYRARHDCEDLLFKRLNHQTPTDEALSDIADAYGLPPLPNGAKRDRAAMLARWLLDLDDGLGPGRFNRLVGGIDTLMAVLNDAEQHVPAIINLVAPFCWVPQEGALALAALAVRPAGQSRAVAWRRSWLLSEHMYLYRAYCTHSTTKLKIVNASDGAGGDSIKILDHIQSSLANETCHNPLASESDVKKKIKELSDRGVPVFLLVPESAVGAGNVNDIRMKWPEVVVILYGENLSPERASRQFPGIEFVETPLAPEVETEARADYGECMKAAGISNEELDSGKAFLR